MLAFSNDYYGLIFRTTQSVELFCAYCKLASLIRIQYLRFGYHECLFQSIYDHSGAKSIVYFPAYDTAAVPINNGCQI